MLDLGFFLNVNCFNQLMYQTQNFGHTADISKLFQCCKHTKLARKAGWVKQHVQVFTTSFPHLKFFSSKYAILSVQYFNTLFFFLLQYFSHPVFFPTLILSSKLLKKAKNADWTGISFEKLRPLPLIFKGRTGKVFLPLKCCIVVFLLHLFLVI